MSETPPALLVRALVVSLAVFAYRYTNEHDLHQGIAEALQGEGYAFQPEYRGGDADRFDFLVDGRIVIEVKVAGSLSAALHQVDRYAAREDVAGVVLVTTCQWGSTADVPGQLRGKPFALLKVQRAVF